MKTRKISKRRKYRIPFCEWNSASFGAYNTGGIICRNCNFNRVYARGEGSADAHDYEKERNKLKRKSNCPNCGSNEDWYFLPPIARVPRNSASSKIWKEFWKNLISGKFNHPEGGCS